MRPPESWKTARVTMALAITATVGLVAIELLASIEWAAIWGGFIPARVAIGNEPGLAPVWLTPLTAAFIHAGWIHLAFNLLILIFCGRPTEGVIGSFGMILLYILGAYAAAGGQYMLGPDSLAPMVGASGAISAVLGAYAILFGRNKVKIANQKLALWLNALWLMVTWVVLNVCVGLAISGTDFFGQGGVEIAVGAHIGGFLIGVLLANPLLLLRYRKA